MRFIFSPNLWQPKTHSHTSVNVSFDGEQRRGIEFLFPPPSPLSLLLPPVKYADTAAHEAVCGFVARIGSVATSQRFKARQGFFRNSQRGSGTYGGEEDCLQLNCAAQLRRIDVGFTEQRCVGSENSTLN